MVFSPDARHILFAVHQYVVDIGAIDIGIDIETRVDLLSVHTGDIHRLFTRNGWWNNKDRDTDLLTAAFSPDGACVAVLDTINQDVDDDRPDCIRVFDMQTRALVCTLQTAFRQLTSVQFTANDALLVSGFGETGPAGVIFVSNIRNAAPTYSTVSVARSRPIVHHRRSFQAQLLSDGRVLLTSKHGTEFFSATGFEANQPLLTQLQDRPIPERTLSVHPSCDVAVTKKETKVGMTQMLHTFNFWNISV